MDNPEWTISQLLKDNKKLVMRMGQLSGWDLDEMFDIEEIALNIIDEDNEWIDDDEDFDRDTLLEYIKDFKDNIAQYAADGEEKTEKELADYIANKWEDTIDDDLLKVVLIKSPVIGYDFDEGGVGKDDPIIEGGMTARQLRWNALFEADSWKDWRSGVKYAEKSDSELRKEAGGVKEDEKKGQKYNIDDEEDEPMDAEDDDDETLVLEWKWKGKTYLLDPDTDHIWDMDYNYIGKRYKIEDDEAEQFMPYREWSVQQYDSDGGIEVEDITYKGKPYYLDPNTQLVYNMDEEQVGKMVKKDIIFD